MTRKMKKITPNVTFVDFINAMRPKTKRTIMIDKQSLIESNVDICLNRNHASAPNIHDKINNCPTSNGLVNHFVWSSNEAFEISAIPTVLETPPTNINIKIKSKLNHDEVRGKASRKRQIETNKTILYVFKP